MGYSTADGKAYNMYIQLLYLTVSELKVIWRYTSIAAAMPVG